MAPEMLVHTEIIAEIPIEVDQAETPEEIQVDIVEVVELDTVEVEDWLKTRDIF